MKPFLFISHSSADKAFARQLDAALSRCGADVFLDERSIEVGQSIPKRIAEGIQAATHFILVVSRNSNGSKWVQDELDRATMRSVSGSGALLLPVRIEEVTIPAAVSHIQCADFLHWQDARAFNAGLVRLLKAIGLPQPALAVDATGWLLRHSQQVTAAQRLATRLETVAETVKCMAVYGVSSMVERPYALDAAQWTLRFYFDARDNPETALLAIETLRDQLVQANAVLNDDTLGHLVHLCDQLVQVTEPVWRSRQGDADAFVALRDHAFRLSEVLVQTLEQAIATCLAGQSVTPQGDGA